MIKCIIIDDEPLAQHIIQEYVSKQADMEVVAICSDGFEAAKSIQALRPDLIFLDIQMPKLTGFELLELLEKPPYVIFTTAFDAYALKAFEKNAVDYLLKPIPPKRFEQAIEKFKLSFQPNQDIQQINTESLQEEYSPELERIVVKSGTQIKIIPVQQICYLEAYDDYVKIHTAEGVFLKNKTMISFEKQLNPKLFVRIHRSFIIRIDQLAKLETWEKDSYIAVLLSGAKVSVSKSGYSRLKQLIGI